jgi:hypothetical protein
MRDRWQICLVRRDNWRKERIREGLERKRRCAGGVAQTRERHTGGVSMMRHGQERTRFGHVRERCGKAGASDAELLCKDRRRVAGLLRQMQRTGDGREEWTRTRLLVRCTRSGEPEGKMAKQRRRL